MKRIYNYLFLISILTLFGCSNWLDIQPKMEMREKDIYETEDGFKSVLIGAYIKMGSSSLYGEKSTMIVPELLAQHWTTSSSTSDATKDARHCIRTFQYDKTSGVSDLLSDLWLSYYSVISNLNSLLHNMELKKEIFTANNYNIIKGEALALRAFLHFDLLRLWGPVPTLANSGDLAIPYVTELTNDPAKLSRLGYGKVMENIMNDLNLAEKLLEEDPIIEYGTDFLNNYHVNNTAIFDDEFLYFRTIRMNCEAVKAVKARVYLWAGNKAKAAEYALEVIHSTARKNGKINFKLSDEETVKNVEGDGLSHKVERIFSVNNPKLEDVITPLFIDFGGLTQPLSKIKIAFESTLHSDDIRNKGTRYWEEVSTGASSSKQNMFKKYLVSEKTSTKNVPVIRLAEMYLIAIECSSLSDAVPLFKKYRISRNMNNIIDNELVDEDAVKARLEKEYRKEFYGEGQMFFFLKRHNYKSVTFPIALTITPENYQIPIPNKQLSFE